MKEYDQIVIFELDKPNRNGRIYTTEALEKAIETNGDKPILGTIGMSAYEVHMKDVSHQITNLRIEDGKVLGTLHILNTPQGEALKTMIADGGVVYRSAGIGNLEEQEDGSNIVKDYHITSINAVNPDTAA